MRIIIVNHCHPEMAHICAVRARELATAMAARGHQIILLTQSLEGASSRLDADKLATTLSGHDFSEFFSLAVHPTNFSRLTALRGGHTGPLKRRMTIAWQYLIHSGVFTDWRMGVRPYIETLTNEFKPDVVWATFGNTDCWNIARDIAHRAQCPWVGDHKDFWQTFMPAPLRQLMANRYSEQQYWTALSETNAAEAQRWFSGDVTTVYSGVPAEWAIVRADQPVLPTQISLTGGLYDRSALDSLMHALITVARQRNVAQSAPVLRLVYAGNDSAQFEDAAVVLPPSIELDVRGYVSLDELRGIYETSAANIYLNSARTFHHKIFELLAVGRPIICIPQEQSEARTLAERAGVPLHSCGTDQNLETALTSILKGETSPARNKNKTFPFTWTHQAEILESVLEQACSGDQ